MAQPKEKVVSRWYPKSLTPTPWGVLLVVPMVRNSIGYGAGVLIAVLTLAGLAAASPAAIFQGEGGGQAEGQAQGDYYVDGSGAVDQAAQVNQDAQGQASAMAHTVDDAYAEQKGEAWAHVNETERPDMPDCGCAQIADELEHVGNAELAHTDEVAKAAEAETGLVDAGADVGASGTVKAFVKDAFTGIGDAFGSLAGVFSMDLGADEDAKDVAEGALDADEEARAQVLSTIDEDRALPDVDPSVDGEFAAEHASEVASSAVGQAQGQVGQP